MITINKIEPITWEAFDPEDNSLGWLNLFEFNDLRIQIKQHQVEGYYMIFNDSVFKNRKIRINRDGKCDGWPNGFYDLFETQLRQLIGI